MNEQKFPQPVSEPAKNSTVIWVIAIIVIVIIGGGIYLWQKSISQKTNSAKTSVGQIYSDTTFSYTCPNDWVLGANQNYGGKIDTSECSKIYSGDFAFDDGVSVTFGFVPQTVADSTDTNGQKYADTIFNAVKNETNAAPYNNNNFTGYISLKNQQHALSLVARYQVTDGYYEVIANAMGDTKTDQQFKQMIDNIISSFNAK